MNALTAVTLILLGALWLFYATINVSVMRTRAFSHASQLEADLRQWTSMKVLEGKLEEADVLEIFQEPYSLRLGGEDPKEDFQQMIAGIAQSGSPPAWPGVVGILVGFLGGAAWLRAEHWETKPQR